MAGRNLVSLPPELQGMIFGLLPVSSLKSMRLVGKQCSAEVAKALWMEATIDIASPRPLKDLLAITTHGFVDSVKKLSIDTEYRGATLSRNRKLRQLLCGLSQNCLTTFRCVVFVVSQESLTILLGRQSHLSELLISADVDENLDHDLIQDTLDRLTSLHFESSISSHRDFRGIHILLKHAPGLRDLAISGHLKSWSMPPRSHLLNLRTLVLSNFHVEAPSVSAQAPFDMPHLEALELTHCSNVAALLQLLAEHNKDGSGYRCLERFTYRSFHAQEIEWDAVVKFLQSAKGLARAVLHSFVPNGRPLPIHHDLGPSVNTLRELQLTSCDPSRLPMWSVSDIESVATSCKTLERLVISLSDEDFSYRCIYHLNPLYISDIRDYAELLVAVARISSLKRLSVVIDPCLIRFSLGYSIQQRQLWYASLADQTMSLLVESGSNVEVLDFGSTFNYHFDVAADDNGHTCPNYSYRIGSVAVDDYEDLNGHEDQQLRKIVAIPAPVAHDGTHF